MRCGWVVRGYERGLVDEIDHYENTTTMDGWPWMTPCLFDMSTSSWMQLMSTSKIAGTPMAETVSLCNRAATHGINLERRVTEHINLWQYRSIRVSISRLSVFD
jgi:hypothetical protein